ncbi:hypothetical protein [Nocardia acidivorans]|uniref:hypothetical protein n=1 Tax=Nocardia acidivorans TaxID=404580 RepID=UPI00082B2F66|nr:hypothetical protein [Nocardia acidivorans]
MITASPGTRRLLITAAAVLFGASLGFSAGLTLNVYGDRIPRIQQYTAEEKLFLDGLDSYDGRLSVMAWKYRRESVDLGKAVVADLRTEIAAHPDSDRGLTQVFVARRVSSEYAVSEEDAKIFVALAATYFAPELL